MLLDERQVPDTSRDRLGNLQVGLEFPRGTRRRDALVEMACDGLRRELIQRGILRDRAGLPRWPHDKRFAVCLTHDTDGPCLLEPPELAKAGIKALLRRNRQEGAAFKEGLARLLRGKDDPYFNFANWAQYERRIGARSTFYIYADHHQVPRHFNNPRYDIMSGKKKWHILRELAAEGWEIGLHASIHALTEASYVRHEKEQLESFLGQPVQGNRCHYWAMNWRDPSQSFQMLQDAGFAYDCSMAWKDSPGFRAGTSLPFHPYHETRAEAFSLLEIPSNVMDGHLFEYQTSEEPASMLRKVAQETWEVGGVLNLDWHTRTWVDRFSYDGWRSVLCDVFSDDLFSEAWLTTPGALTNYWIEREVQLGVGAQSKVGAYA